MQHIFRPLLKGVSVQFAALDAQSTGETQDCLKVRLPGAKREAAFAACGAISTEITGNAASEASPARRIASRRLIFASGDR